MQTNDPTTTVYRNLSKPGASVPVEAGDNDQKYLATLRGKLSELTAEITERNDNIMERDAFVYSDRLERSIDIPIGHDFTPVNWLKRTVEIHKTMFMGRPFQLLSTYDTQDLSMVGDETDRQRKEADNKQEKTLAELRRNVIDSIIRDNGGHALFADGAESASVIGSWVIKAYYDEDEDKYVLSPVEAVENCYAVWSKDDFRRFDLFAYIYQITKQKAAELYGAPDDVVTSPLGKPLSTSSSNSTSTQPMVTVLEATGKLEGWCSKKGKLFPCPLGDENDINVLFIGDQQMRLVDDAKKLPKYYVFPNKKARRRPWGMSDITDAAININVTYIETLSDWRTLAAKVNFPKFKGFNFGPDTQMPKLPSRKIGFVPLVQGQDIVPLQTGDANRIDFASQLNELKEQFVRETGISRVLFDDPSVTFNSNQALLTSMKPTSDIAENKKQLWAPILVQLFTDAIDTISQFKTEFKGLSDGNWSLKVQYPSVMQKEDPIFQQMLLNRWNSGTISMQSYLEMQGETKEEIDRIRDEFSDPVTAAALGKAFGPLAQYVLGLPASQAEMGGQPAVATPANNVPGSQPVSQPGSGATPVGPQGALDQANQTMGG